MTDTADQDDELSQLLTAWFEGVLQEAREAWEADLRRQMAEISANLDAIARELDAKHTEHPRRQGHARHHEGRT